jgi:hypothetical protein
MTKLDRLGWAAGICGVAYGVRIGIRVSQVSALAPVQQLLPPGWERARSPLVDHLYSVIGGGEETRPGVRRFNLLYRGPTRLARELDLTQVLDLLDSDLQLRVAEWARGRVFVHAGVVGWRGKAIVIPGKSYSGKTTLVAALVRAGAVYYSDEYAVLDSVGRVHPYLKPLSIRQETGQRPKKCTADELGSTAGRVPLPVGTVLISKYRFGAIWRPRSLSPGQGLLALLSHSVPARRQPQRTVRTLRNALTGARIVKGIRGEADELADEILGNEEWCVCRSPGACSR